jgi:hypothetical protein
MLFNVELVEKEAIKWRSRPLLKHPFKALGKCLSLGISHVSGTHPHRSSTLKTLIFQSSMFLLPPFSGWAFKILNTAPLTKLDLVEVQLSYASRIPALVFGALTIPTLEHLRIINCQFEFDVLAEFLSRHNTILTFEFISGTRNLYQLPITTLPALVLLKSNPYNIIRLLTPTGAFPKLAHIRVVVHFSANGGFMSDTMNYSQAAKRLTETNVRLCLDVLPALPVHLWLNLEILPNDLRNHPVLSHVRDITFGVPLPDVVATAAILTWLSMFPLLEHIEFLNMPMGLDYEAKMSLLRRIAQKCAGIRTVRIGDDTRDISVWLSSDS